MESGFFTRESIKTRTAGVKKDVGLSVAGLRELGLRGIRNMNPKAHNPLIEPLGASQPEIYLLQECPSVVEDEAGRFIVGSVLDPYIPSGVKFRFNAVVRTLPINRGGKIGHTPNQHEISCFSPSLEDDIEASKPKIILAMGDTAIKWVLKNSKIACSVVRGRSFPVRIKKHLCWVYCCHHPAYISQLLHAEGYTQISGEEHEKYFGLDVTKSFNDLSELSEPFIEPTDATELFRGVTIETKSVGKIVAFLSRLATSEKNISIDVETNRKRPYSAGAKLLTVAIGTAKEVITFPIDHPQAIWSSSEKNQLLITVRKFLESKVGKIAHFTSFDCEWLDWKFGHGILHSGTWHDTACQAYLIDERKGGFSLNFLCLLHFGVQLKSLSVGSTSSTWFGMADEEEGEIDRSKLEQTNVDDVLRYNALDTKFTHKLFVRQRQILKQTNGWTGYLKYVKRIPSIVLAQNKGMLVDQKEVGKNGDILSKKQSDTVRKIKEQPSIIEFQKRFGAYSHTSVPCNVKFFRDFLGRTEGKRGEKYSTDEDALAAMHDEPVAKLLLDIRGYDKLRGTYVERMRPTHEKALVYPDGKLHPRFKYVATDTGRLSSSDPNAQNWPKRNDAWIRREVVAPPGHVMIACDQGQLEYRVIGMASKDRVIVDSLFNDYDVHMAWAEKIAKIYPKVVRDRHGNLSDKSMKAFRGELKTDVIFPWFYGATLGLAARALDQMPRERLQPIWDEFWYTFKGVKKFQQNQKALYEENGFVRTMSGRVRHGPMSNNMLINASIQGDASDIVVWSWNKLCRLSCEQDKPWLAPIINVHDDLSFYVPIKKQDEAIDTIKHCMLKVPFDYINVPLQLEVSVGPNWYDRKEIGRFRSDKL